MLATLAARPVKSARACSVVDLRGVRDLSAERGWPIGSGRDRPEEAACPARRPVGRRAGRVAACALKT